MEKNTTQKVSRDFKGVWIPKEIWLTKDLTLIEKLFLVEIDSLDNENHCFASNGYFSEFFDISKSRSSQIISSLVDKKFIKIDYLYEGKEIKKRIIRVLNKLNKGIKNTNGGIKNIKGGYLENAKDNNTLINNTINKIDYNKKYDEIWKHYPKKVGKAEGYKKYLVAVKKHGEEKIFRLSQIWINDFLRRKDDIKYCVHICRFYSNERYLDAEHIQTNEGKTALTKTQIAG